MNARCIAAFVCWLVAVHAWPAHAAPECVRAAVVPAKVPPAKDEWVPSARRAASLGSDAKMALEQGRAAEAVRLVTRAIETDQDTNPSERDYYSLRAAALAAQGDRKASEAIKLYNDASRAADRGDFVAGRRLYEAALVEDPGFLWAANNRAWLAATHPDPEARKDPDAIAYAMYACVKSDWHNWSFIDTLAAAYAEAGDFASAERCAERALALAPSEQRRHVRDALTGYRKKRPRRQDAATTRAADGAPAADRPAGRGDDAPGRNVVMERVTLEELVRAMGREGYAVVVREGRFIEWNIDGVKSQLFIAQDGESIQFHVAFNDDSATLARVNEWNRSKRYSRSYLDAEGDPHLELDLACTGGICEGRVLDFLRSCRLSLSVWVREVVR